MAKSSSFINLNKEKANPPTNLNPAPDWQMWTDWLSGKLIGFPADSIALLRIIGHPIRGVKLVK
jgi:hypothetical protein